MATLGIHLAGGAELRVRDDAGVWQSTADTVLQLRAERARADRLAARLRAAGLDPGD